jgi:hypothetical protein
MADLDLAGEHAHRAIAVNAHPAIETTIGGKAERNLVDRQRHRTPQR